MFRTIFWLLMTVLGITLLRTVIGAIAKMVFGLTGQASATVQKRPEQAPAGGVLRKDPVCGVYVSEALSIKMQQGGQTLHFCSSKCRDAFQAHPAA
jgi:YHS domain-containing protein